VTAAGRTDEDRSVRDLPKFQAAEESQQVRHSKASYARSELAAPEDSRIKWPGQIGENLEERFHASSPCNRASNRFIAVFGTEKIGKTRVHVTRLPPRRMGKHTEGWDLDSRCTAGSQFQQEEFESQVKGNGRNDIIHILVGRKEFVQAVDGVSVQCLDR
jgi:hypothetical protein